MSQTYCYLLPEDQWNQLDDACRLVELCQSLLGGTSDDDTLQIGSADLQGLLAILSSRLELIRGLSARVLDPDNAT
uniref:Uncharacterized protein n=1 Tax=Marinobacter nauticus TaxID=2743 RepID=A0A455WE75_MARNT|nr:hypothetical protein YBY_30060 [Marinobacter nauticus]